MHEALKVTWKSWLIRLLQLSDTWFFLPSISSVDTLPCQDRSSSRVKGLTSSARLRMPLDSSAYPREMLRCQRLERTADALKMLRSLRPPSMGSKILRPNPTCRGVGWRSALTVTPRRTVGLQVWIFLALCVYVCVYLSLKCYHSKYTMCQCGLLFKTLPNGFRLHQSSLFFLYSKPQKEKQKWFRMIHTSMN